LVWGRRCKYSITLPLQVALWNQKLGDPVVVWDYHVILVLKRRSADRPGDGLNDGEPQEARPWRKWVYDLDSRLEMPCSWDGA